MGHDKYDAIDAFEMFCLFMDGYDEANVTLKDEAFAQLSEVFDKVDAERRADVFVIFLEFLNDADVLFDITKFNI